MKTYRWIAYVMENIPGNQSFDLIRTTSLDAVREHVATLAREWGMNCSATAYAYGEESWGLAEEFRGIGCPFDYPDYIVEFGPRGGIKIERA